MGLALYHDPKAVKPEEVRFKVAIAGSPDTPTVFEGGAAVEELIGVSEVAYLTIRGLTQDLKTPTASSLAGLF